MSDYADRNRAYWTGLNGDYTSQRRIGAASSGSTEFHPSHSEWIALLAANGFSVERLEELYAPSAARQHEFYKFANVEWAKRWPLEEIWVARKRASA